MSDTIRLQNFAIPLIVSENANPHQIQGSVLIDALKGGLPERCDAKKIIHSHYTLIKSGYSDSIRFRHDRLFDGYTLFDKDWMGRKRGVFASFPVDKFLYRCYTIGVYQTSNQY